ncbi:MAG: TlpA family protein disulfide reductase [Lachnospiraceae bacterium]|nr:TlpA family protein disulfide reductase [Lachnospiraceae bacterium]
MKRFFRIVLACLLCPALLSGCKGPSADTSDSQAESSAFENSVPEGVIPGGDIFMEDPGPFAEDMAYSPGDHVENFRAELCDGTVVTLKTLLQDHELVMINVWATWCNPCVMELPVMNAAWEQYKDKVALVALSPYDDNEAVAQFRTENGLTLPMGADTIGADSLVQEGYPTTVLIDRFGTYVYYECGMILDEEEFFRMWEPFLGEDYTESRVVYSMSESRYTGEYCPEQQLNDALCPDGSITFRHPEDPALWPFMPQEDGIINTTEQQDGADAAVTATITATAGQVLALDYSIDLEPGMDYLSLSVNGEEVKGFTGTVQGSYAWEFPEDGTYEVMLLVTKDEVSSPEAGFCLLKKAALLSGEEAAAALAAVEETPHSLADIDMEVEFLTGGVKEIIITADSREVAQVLDGFTLWLVPSPDKTVRYRTLIGEELDAARAATGLDSDGVLHVCSLTEADETGYLCEGPLSCVEEGGYESTYLYLFPNTADMGLGRVMMLFVNEENVNYFVDMYMRDDNGNPFPGIHWEYADGTQPSTTDIAASTAPGYEIFMIDQDGQPVDGAMVNICTDDACSPVVLEGGYFSWDSDPCTYVIHVLAVPEGYSFDETAEYTMTGGALTIIIHRD